MAFIENLKKARAKAGFSQKELASIIFMSQQAYAQYESGKTTPSPETLSRIAKALNVSVDKLLDIVPEKAVQAYPIAGVIALPVLESVKAGYDGIDEVVSEEVDQIPLEMLMGYNPEEVRILKVRGDSMYPKICDGDKVLIHVQTSVDSGDIAVVIYDGNEATIKRVRYVYGEDWLELIPANPEYKTKRIEGSDLEQCMVFGKVMKLIRDF